MLIVIPSVLFNNNFKLAVSGPKNKIPVLLTCIQDFEKHRAFLLGTPDNSLFFNIVHDDDTLTTVHC